MGSVRQRLTEARIDCNVVLVGDVRVGKSALVNRFLNNRFVEVRIMPYINLHKLPHFTKPQLSSVCDLHSKLLYFSIKIIGHLQRTKDSFNYRIDTQNND